MQVLRLKLRTILLTYLEQEGNTLTNKERSALLENPHENNYDYENTKAELMNQLTEKDAEKILGNFGVEFLNISSLLAIYRHSARTHVI